VSKVLPGGQLGSAAQPGDLALLACFGLHFQHLQHHAQRLLLPGLLQPAGQFDGGGGQFKAHQQLAGALGNRAGIHGATSALSSAS
jgi:hypothetical protein